MPSQNNEMCTVYYTVSLSRDTVEGAGKLTCWLAKSVRVRQIKLH